MSNIDEIMGAVGRHGDDCIRDADAASASFEALREMIAAALADARREGAEAMRSECLTCCDALEDSAWKQYKPALGGNCDPHHQGRSDGAAEVGASIRALPLPTGPRQAVLLTDAEVRQIGDATLYAGGIYDRVQAIETAVLAANGLEVRRG